MCAINRSERRSDATRSRAMAVGAYENRVTLYALKTMERMRDEVQNSEGLDAANFMPIRDVSPFLLEARNALTVPRRSIWMLMDSY